MPRNIKLSKVVAIVHSLIRSSIEGVSDFIGNLMAWLAKRKLSTIR